jgi:hypothetical protein
VFDDLVQASLGTLRSTGDLNFISRVGIGFGLNIPMGYIGWLPPNFTFASTPTIYDVDAPLTIDTFPRLALR